MTMLLIKLRVLIFIPTTLIGLFIFTATDVEGYASWCDINQTIFVPEESTASFLVNLTYRPYYAPPYYDYGMHFYKDESIYHRIFYARVRDNNITDDDVSYLDRSWQNRTHISTQLNTIDQIGVRIDIHNISMKDNGTYRLNVHEDACFILFVMQIRSEPSENGVIEEIKPVYVYAHPHASLITRPLTNATMVWLLDGLSVNQTASFIQQDGLIWIPHIQRGMDGRNATYRAIQDNGNVNEVNYTLNVTYGPSQPLILIPRRTQYYLVSGDVMPDIICTVDCKPSCSISWGKYSSSGILSLGTVTSDDTGQYTCTAKRTGVKSVEQIVYIHVADNTSFTVAIACLAAVQGLTTLGLGLCAYIIYRRTKQSPCQTCFNTSARKTQNKHTEDVSSMEGADNHDQEPYEDLNTDTRQTNVDYETTTEAGLETYENIRLSSSSSPEAQLTHI